MDYSEIKKMMQDMEEMKLTELSVEFPDGTKVSLKKDYSNHLIPREEVMPTVIKSEKKEMVEVQEQQCDDDIKIVKSPMVGTYYEKSSPTADKFVEVGTKVKKGDILCIIEAMKLMNEIESEYDGEIAEILVHDGDAVEYGMPLFKIK